RRIDRLRHRGSLIGVLQLLDQHADLVAAARKALLDRLVQVGPVKEHLRFGGGLRGAVVDAAQIERPRSGEDRAAQRDLIAYLPSVLHGELAADEPSAGARVGAGVPRVDDGTQQSERADRDHDADDRECRAQLVSQRVLDDEAKEIHRRIQKRQAYLMPRMQASELFRMTAWK